MTTVNNAQVWTPKTTNSNAYCWKPTGCAAVLCTAQDAAANPKIKDAAGADCVEGAVKIEAPPVASGCTTKATTSTTTNNVTTLNDAGNSPAFSAANFYTESGLTFCTPNMLPNCMVVEFCTVAEVNGCAQETYCRAADSAVNACSSNPTNTTSNDDKICTIGNNNTPSTTCTVKTAGVPPGNN